MIDRILELPLAGAIGVLWSIVLLRAGGTYALGRFAGRLSSRSRLGPHLDGPRVARAIDRVNRWGAPVVALSFLTIGFQTAANAAAGLTRMPLTRYLPALAIGALAWAILYATVGLAAVAVWLELFLASPWAAVLIPAVLVIGAAMIVRRCRARVRRSPEPALLPSQRPRPEHRSPCRTDDHVARTR